MFRVMVFRVKGWGLGCDGCGLGGRVRGEGRVRFRVGG